MTATRRFIEDAIAGGWKPVDEIMPSFFLWRTPFKVFVSGHLCSLYFETDIPNAKKENILVRVSEILLDPLAWQAVGKTRRWGKREILGIGTVNVGMNGYKSMWLAKQHDFIDHLADGLSIEEALSKTDVTTGL